MTVVKSRGFSASQAIAALHSMGCAKHTRELGRAVLRYRGRKMTLADSEGTALECCAGAVESKVSTLPCVIDGSA